MGFFTDSYYVVSTSTQRVVEDRFIDDSAKLALLRAIMANGDIPDYLLDGLVQSAGFKVERLYRYIQEHYPQGMLHGEIKSNRGHTEVVKAAIESERGIPVELVYAHLTSLNPTHLLWQTLVDQYAYDPETNQLDSFSASEGWPVYLKNFLITVPKRRYLQSLEDGTLTTFGEHPREGYTPERPVVDLQDYNAGKSRYPTVGEGIEELGPITAELQLLTAREEAEQAAQYDDEGNLVAPEIVRTVLDEWTESVSLGEPDTESEYFQAYYHDGERYRYWTYQYGEGSHPDLDSVLDLSFQETSRAYLPVIYFRRNYQNFTAEDYRDTSEYRAASRALEFLGMDYQELGEGIHESEDIDAVRNAYMMFGIRADSQDQTDLRYLHEYFKEIATRIKGDGFDAGGSSGLTRLLTRAELNSDAYLVNIRSQDLGPYNIGAHMTIAFKDVGVRIRGGKIGAQGTYDRIDDVERVRYKALAPSYDAIAIDDNPEEVIAELPCYIYRFQRWDSYYEEVRVVRPKLRHMIDGSGRNTYASINENVENLILPLDHELLEMWSIQDRERLYLRSLHFVFNAREKEELAWYESGLFRTIITIAAIAITFWSGFQAWQVVTATATLQAAAMAVLTIIVKAVVFSYAFQFVVEQIGMEAALVLAAVFALYGGVKALQAGSIKGAPFASELLQLSNGLAKAVNDQAKKEIGDLQQESEQFGLYTETKWEELEAAQGLLETTSLLDPYDWIIAQPFTLFGESPADYYQRSIHTGNIGTLAFDAIEHYVDISLKLPDINDTVGGSFHA